MRAAEGMAATLPPDAGGRATAAMMEAAGAALAAAVLEKAPEGPVVVLAGPGGNGGDGWVAARALQAAGRAVCLAFMGNRQRLVGDAALMASLYEGDVKPATQGAVAGAAAIVDALFGAGLSRPLAGEAAAVVGAVNEARARSGAFVIAADLPSGLFADLGAAPGPTATADLTLAFGAKKACHLLYPARGKCGEVVLMDVGIAPRAILAQGPRTFENGPAIWGGTFPRLTPSVHKYDRGGVAVAVGPALATGAARLAAHGALRVGAGAVTLLGDAAAAAICAGQVTSAMVRAIDTPADFGDFVAADRVRAAVIGPGTDVGERTRNLCAAASGAGRVLDADALTSFAADPEALFRLATERDVLTPHAGEFARVFPDLAEAAVRDKLTATRDAAARAGCVVLLKGPDTVIAAPDGRAAINANAPADLATAGSGDVLAGFIAGLIAQAMPSFEAACAGAWLHGACGQALGRGLIAEDLPGALPSVFRALFAPSAPQRGGKGR
ncbi:MAG: NAD(P)H-hydrate dehydratase [Alphaproteobacteria bacterium]|nr:NAD(P)H-hydrate dehydratase [Alphaproteobacteria bacterium]